MSDNIFVDDLRDTDAIRVQSKDGLNARRRTDGSWYGDFGRPVRYHDGPWLVIQRRRKSDPVIEAVQRAADHDGLVVDFDSAEAAAREALAPIRELHGPCSAVYGQRGPQVCRTCRREWIDHTKGLLRADWVPWPCNTARLAYTTEEINAWFARNRGVNDE